MARDPSKTEQATPKRVKKARGKGNVAKSAEVSKTVTLLAGFIMLYAYAGTIATEMQGLFRHFLQNDFAFTPDPSSVIYLMRWLATELATLVLPIMLFIAASVIIVMRIEVGKLWTTEVFKPKLSRLNPLPGIKRMFISKDTAIRMGKSLLQALVIGFAPYVVIKNELPNFILLYNANAAGLASYLLSISYKVVLYALIPMLIIAVADLFYTRWDYKENLKMTKDEIKDEIRQMEGDPKIKAKQKQKMYEVMRRRMMQEVPKADVIITNPTHIAVALKYDALEAPAPMVVAKGADHMAEKIKEIAREAGVPIRENKPLARALYKSVEVGEVIPEEMYQAVAAILASLSKFKTQAASQRTVEQDS